MIRNSPIGDDLKAGSFSARWKEGVIPYTFASNISKFEVAMFNKIRD